MEGPYYEMTHDIQTESKIAIEFYNKGYSQGIFDGGIQLSKTLCGYSDEELLKWKESIKNGLEFMQKEEFKCEATERY